jgi:hypothetical protein
MLIDSDSNSVIGVSDAARTSGGRAATEIDSSAPGQIEAFHRQSLPRW